MGTKSETSMSGRISRFAAGGNCSQEIPLVLGFAYSLTPEGAPGLYNQILAMTIIDHWSGRDAWIGVQWEISDAMDDPQSLRTLRSHLTLKPSSIAARTNLLPPSQTSGLPEIHTVPPFNPIAGEDVVEWRAFRKWLLNALEPHGDPAVAVLARMVARIAGQAGYTNRDDRDVLQAALYGPEQVALYLNRLIQTEKDFHKDFWVGKEAILELHDRQRHEFGPVGFEKRQLPARDETLGQYQNQRVNRLIIEAICPERSILCEPGYLSTRGVLQHLFSQMPDKVRGSGTPVYIYGSPVHSARCRRQFIEFAWSVGWSVRPDQVRMIYCADHMADCGWMWDERTAQVWCRSEIAWDAYETNSARLR